MARSGERVATIDVDADVTLDGPSPHGGRRAGERKQRPRRCGSLSRRWDFCDWLDRWTAKPAWRCRPHRAARQRRWRHPPRASLACRPAGSRRHRNVRGSNACNAACTRSEPEGSAGSVSETLAPAFKAASATSSQPPPQKRSDVRALPQLDHPGDHRPAVDISQRLARQAAEPCGRGSR